MARSRNIKPGFFLNDELADLDPLVRLLFIGLWTICDKQGRCMNRPRRIQVSCMPYDQINIEKSLDLLEKKNFIFIYGEQGNEYIQVVNWRKHQHPHHKEVDSEIPEYQEDTHVRNMHETCMNMQEPSMTTKASIDPSDSLNLIPDSLNPINGQNKFDRFWKCYPRKVKKKRSKEIWISKKLNPKLDQILSDIQTRLDKHVPWKNGFIPHPTTYLNGERWNDEIEEKELVKGNGKIKLPSVNDHDGIDKLGRQLGMSAKTGEDYWQYRQRLQAAL